LLPDIARFGQKNWSLPQEGGPLTFDRSISKLEVKTAVLKELSGVRLF